MEPYTDFLLFIGDGGEEGEGPETERRQGNLLRRLDELLLGLGGGGIVSAVKSLERDKCQKECPRCCFAKAMKIVGLW